MIYTRTQYLLLQTSKSLRSAVFPVIRIHCLVRNTFDVAGQCSTLITQATTVKDNVVGVTRQESGDDRDVERVCWRSSAGVHAVAAAERRRPRSACRRHCLLYCVVANDVLVLSGNKHGRHDVSTGRSASRRLNCAAR